VREFLSEHEIPFDDRNIRASELARAELEGRTGSLVVPQLFWRDRRIVGFDPDALAELVRAHAGDAT
jgi:glutaredoxin